MSVVVTGEMQPQLEQASHEQAESALAPDAGVAGENPVAASAATPEVSLPLAVASSPSSPPSLRFVQDDQVLVDAVMKEFDPAHRLRELETEWSAVRAGAASFDKSFRLVVSFSVDASLVVFSSFVRVLYFSFFCQEYSQDSAIFFGSSESEGKLNSQIEALKAELKTER